MKQSSLAALSPIPLTLLAAACGGLDPIPTQEAALTQHMPPTTPSLHSAGNVTLGTAPDRDPKAIAALRARGRAALAELLARYDELADGPAKTALAATIDQVAAQRYATASRLYWHTELGAAIAEARDTGKPVLSLRMLGRLDEDLSCANSRFFRTILYPDPAIAKLLREQFILHWSSERAVPRVTIDFGDGRKIERTVTGNSVHYVLDPSGRPIDALPGLYAPSVFAVELDRSLELYRTFAAGKGLRNPGVLRDHHTRRQREVADQWAGLGSTITFDVGAGRILRGNQIESALSRAQRGTMTKMAVEVPQIAQIDVGPDPAVLLRDIDTWAVIGQALYGVGEPPAAEPGSQFVRRPRPIGPRSLGILSAPARALIAQVMQGDARLPAATVDAAIARLETSMLADTAINEQLLRQQIRGVLASSAPSFDELNRFVYANVFATPAEDQWLGLLPRDVFSGIPGDGVVIPR